MSASKMPDNRTSETSDLDQLLQDLQLASKSLDQLFRNLENYVKKTGVGRLPGDSQKSIKVRPASWSYQREDILPINEINQNTDYATKIQDIDTNVDERRNNDDVKVSVSVRSLTQQFEPSNKTVSHKTVKKRHGILEERLAPEELEKRRKVLKYL